MEYKRLPKEEEMLILLDGNISDKITLKKIKEEIRNGNSTE